MAGHGISSTHLGVYRGSELKFLILQGKPIDLKPKRTHLRPSRMMSYNQKKHSTLRMYLAFEAKLPTQQCEQIHVRPEPNGVVHAKHPAKSYNGPGGLK